MFFDDPATVVLGVVRDVRSGDRGLPPAANDSLPMWESRTTAWTRPCRILSGPYGVPACPVDALCCKQRS